MMVSKVAVMALVAIIAVPILLGYGMNFNETTATGYRLSEDRPMNLTNQLENGNTGASYTFAHSDLLQMNSEFETYGVRVYPHYESIIDSTTTIPGFQNTVKNVNLDTNAYTSIFKYYYMEFSNPYVMTISLFSTDNGTESYVTTLYGVLSIYVLHDGNVNRVQVKYISGSGINVYSHSGTGYNITRIYLLTSPGYTTDYYESYLYSENSGYDNDKYIDLSQGYYLGNTRLSNSNPELWPNISLPDYTKQFTLTMNLDSITDPNYTLHINVAPHEIMRSTIPYTNIPIQLQKTTVGSAVNWTLTNEYDSSEEVTELYYDPELTDNTYQFTISADCIYDETTAKYYLTIHVIANYVGSWSTLVGIANPYITYDLNYVIRDDPTFIYNSPLTEGDLIYYCIFMSADNAARTPTMRVDDALYRAFEYRTITDRTFDPVKYTVGNDRNPVTTITILNKYGTSISFGGHVYAVKNGNISLSGHDVPVNNIELSSILNESGTYDNKIGNTVISTTAEPSKITLNGSWSASVVVHKMESYTYTKTEWVAGQFAWDGLDQNFLMIGLMTSLGAFIAIGIYMRRTRTSLWPLLLVCGGAAALFLFML